MISTMAIPWDRLYNAKEASVVINVKECQVNGILLSGAEHQEHASKIGVMRVFGVNSRNAHEN